MPAQDREVVRTLEESEEIVIGNRGAEKAPHRLITSIWQSGLDPGGAGRHATRIANSRSAL
jgi:hypothetical protein